jgi:hypothetical protein
MISRLLSKIQIKQGADMVSINRFMPKWKIILSEVYYL